MMAGPMLDTLAMFTLSDADQMLTVAMLVISYEYVVGAPLPVSSVKCSLMLSPSVTLSTNYIPILQLQACVGTVSVTVKVCVYVCCR